jgi:D-amino peptidase
MKILISADMEGISGVAVWDHVTPGTAEYQRFRMLMVGDVNAAVDGAFSGGAREVVVTDSHWYGLNIPLEALDLRASLNSGLSAPLAMMQGVETAHGVVLVGCHPRCGTRDATLDHTWSYVSVYNVRIDGTLVGEIGMNAALAGHYGIPLIAATGDANACAEARDVGGEALSVAVVKTATGQFSAECKPLPVARRLITEAVADGVRKLARGAAPAPRRTSAQVELTVELKETRFADRAGLMPGVERLDGRTIRYVGPDVVTAWNAFRVLVAAARD